MKTHKWSFHFRFCFGCCMLSVLFKVLEWSLLLVYVALISPSWTHPLQVSISRLEVQLPCPPCSSWAQQWKAPSRSFPWEHLYFYSPCWNGYHDHPLKNSTLHLPTLFGSLLCFIYHILTLHYRFVFLSFPIHTYASYWLTLLVAPSFIPST